MTEEFQRLPEFHRVFSRQVRHHQFLLQSRSGPLWVTISGKFRGNSRLLQFLHRLSRAHPFGAMGSSAVCLDSGLPHAPTPCSSPASGVSLLTGDVDLVLDLGFFPLPCPEPAGFPPAGRTPVPPTPDSPRTKVAKIYDVSPSKTELRVAEEFATGRRSVLPVNLGGTSWIDYEQYCKDIVAERRAMMDMVDGMPTPTRTGGTPSPQKLVKTKRYLPPVPIDWKAFEREQALANHDSRGLPYPSQEPPIGLDLGFLDG